jgi:aryl-alcohol dehydrogenase-like predicted oxidoreductase
VAQDVLFDYGSNFLVWPWFTNVAILLGAERKPNVNARSSADTLRSRSHFCHGAPSPEANGASQRELRLSRMPESQVKRTLASMRIRTLGPLEVSVVGLGCNNFGRRVGESGTRAVVDAALDAGVTFYDTAESYGGGQSETFLGHALHGRRHQIVLATKFGGGGAVGRGKGSREEIHRSLEASLRRLQTDYIDLYQHHQEDTHTPLAETIAALDELVHEGKIRAYGTSNYSPARIEEAATLAREAYVSEQSEYSLLARAAERDLLPMCARLGLGFIPYFPLASGLLTGKYRRDRPPPEGTRLHGQEISEEKYDRVEALEAFAREHGASLLEVAIGGLAAQPPVTSVIAGATKPEQVRENAAAGAWEPIASDLVALRALD